MYAKHSWNWTIGAGEVKNVRKFTDTQTNGHTDRQTYAVRVQQWTEKLTWAEVTKMFGLVLDKIKNKVQ